MAVYINNSPARRRGFGHGYKLPPCPKPRWENLWRTAKEANRRFLNGGGLLLFRMLAILVPWRREHQPLRVKRTVWRFPRMINCMCLKCDDSGWPYGSQKPQKPSKRSIFHPQFIAGWDITGFALTWAAICMTSWPNTRCDQKHLTLCLL